MTLGGSKLAAQADLIVKRKYLSCPRIALKIIFFTSVPGIHIALKCLKCSVLYQRCMQPMQLMEVGNQVTCYTIKWLVPCSFLLSRELISNTICFLKQLYMKLLTRCFLTPMNAWTPGGTASPPESADAGVSWSWTNTFRPASRLPVLVSVYSLWWKEVGENNNRSFEKMGWP